MPPKFKFGVALLTLVFAIAPALTTLSFSTPVQVSAACHHPDRQTPTPKSTDNACCKNGHSRALLQSSSAIGINGAQSEIIRAASIVRGNSYRTVDVTFSAEDPPGVLPLRI